MAVAPAARHQPAAARDQTGSGATPREQRAHLPLSQPPRAVPGTATEGVFRILGVVLLLLAASVAGSVVARPAANGEGAAPGRVKSGTGFFVSRDGFLVTSAHVVAGCQNLSVWEPDGTERPSYIIASDRRLDLALLWTDGAGARYSAVAAGEPPRAGEKVFTLGFGVIAKKPLAPVLIEGSLVGDSTAQPGNRILVIRAMFHAGNSGGAVLAGNGSLLGMVIGRDQEHPELGLAIPSGDIEGLLLTYGITLPKRDSVANAADFLSAISVLIQCSTSSNSGARQESRF